MQGRGLKRIIFPRQGRLCRVAPYVGAWIETWIMSAFCTPLIVAPYVGAWIETKWVAHVNGVVKC